MTRATQLVANVLVVLLAGLAAGCTSTSSGDPRPENSATEPAADGPRVSSTLTKRPQEIRLDNVDPCALLPGADYPDFHLDEPGKPEQDDRGAKQCAWFGEVGYMDVTLVTFEGVEAREGRNGRMEPTDPIDGFPAYTITLPSSENPCFVVVDVADGQHLDVQVGLYESQEKVPPACEYAHQFASSVMSTLVES